MTAQPGPAAELEAAASENDGLQTWTRAQWDALLLAIKYQRCTPFLGAGACAGTLPLGREIAARWAEKYGYPFEDRHNLPRVAQYLAVSQADLPRFLMQEELKGKGPPDFTRPDEIHAVVARLPLPVYITTNYDSFMATALTAANRTPRVESCSWRSAFEIQALAPAAPFHDPTPEAPLVYHMHGTLDDLPSIVLTEDDYLDFLVAVADVNVIPKRVQRAFGTSLLFLGYSLEDMNFKVLFRKLAGYMQRAQGAVHLSVQLSPSASASSANRQPTPEERKRIEEQRAFLRQRLGLQRVDVFWGTCQQFAEELGQRWAEFAKK